VAGNVFAHRFYCALRCTQTSGIKLSCVIPRLRLVIGLVVVAAAFCAAVAGGCADFAVVCLMTAAFFSAKPANLFTGCQILIGNLRSPHNQPGSLQAGVSAITRQLSAPDHMLNIGGFEAHRSACLTR
jgi:L-cystine uptake protein TcyP (sodium:dicarboxylate symporter family)